MLVRNNTVCPRCGILSFTDVYLHEQEPLTNRYRWVVRAECFDCLYATERAVPVHALRDWIRFLSDDKDPSKKWSSAGEPFSLNQLSSIWRSFERILPRGGVSHRSHDWNDLLLFIEWLRSGPCERWEIPSAWYYWRSGATFSK